MANANFCLVLPVRLHRHRVNACGEVTPFRKFGIGGHIGKLRIHVLHTGHTERCCVLQRSASSAEPLLVRHWWDHLVDQLLRSILENASGISARVAHDYSAGHIGSFRVYAGKFHRSRVGERFVSVVALYKNWRRSGHGIDELFGRKLRIGPLGFIPTTA